jgi:excisionase family DNA binding protein
MADIERGVEAVGGGLFTVTEATEFSRVSRSLLYSLMDSGELAYTKVGRRRLIPRRGLLEMLSRGLVDRQSGPVDSGF